MVSFIEYLLSSGHQINPNDTLVNNDDIIFLCLAWERPSVHRRHEYQAKGSLRPPQSKRQAKNSSFCSNPGLLPSLLSLFYHTLHLNLLDLKGFERTIYSLHWKEPCSLLSGKRQECYSAGFDPITRGIILVPVHRNLIPLIENFQLIIVSTMRCQFQLRGFHTWDIQVPSGTHTFKC